MSTAGNDYILACRLHSEALFCRHYLQGVGMYDERGESARITAERNMALRGWTPDQVQDWTLRPEKLPNKPPSAGKDRSYLDADDSVRAISATLRRLGRRFSEPNPATAEVSRPIIRRILARLRGTAFEDAIAPGLSAGSAGTSPAPARQAGGWADDPLPSGTSPA